MIQVVEEERMIDLTPEAFAILRRQHGHASIRQLADAGVGRNARRRLSRAKS
jgi:hypothetical protein